MPNLKIKVCGMKDVDNIQALSKLPIDYIGFIFYDQSKRFLNQTFETTNLKLDNLIKTGVFVNATVEYIQSKIEEYRLQAVQLHGTESPSFCETVKSLNVTVIKAFGIDELFDWTILDEYENKVDYFLFDTKTTDHGGSGKTFSWSLLDHYQLATSYFLSGGLSIDNIEEVLKIKDTRLYALDLNSKFEIEPALKNIKLIEQALKLLP